MGVTGQDLVPFRIVVPEEALADLRDRLDGVRWAPEPQGGDEGYGVPNASPGSWLRTAEPTTGDGRQARRSPRAGHARALWEPARGSALTLLALVSSRISATQQSRIRGRGPIGRGHPLEMGRSDAAD